MKHIRLHIAFLVPVLIAIALLSFAKPEKKDPIVVMAYYVPEKNYNPEQLPLNQLTHIIFSFTNIIDGEMKFGNSEAGEKLAELVEERKKHPHLKVMIACGGWGADGFSDMASTKENRAKFINSAVAFNRKYELDGLDIDWEYPAIPAAGTGARPEDKQNFTLLMKELREALDDLEREQTLTFASAGWKRYYDSIELSEVMRYADFMNVMTYDQVGGNSPYTGHHTALGLIRDDDVKETPFWNYVKERRAGSNKGAANYGPRSVERIINFCIEKGVKPQQLVIGAAFYGRAWKGVPSTNNGLYQPNTGTHIGWSAYAQIRSEFETDVNYKRYWDPVAKAPYLYSPQDEIFITYDDTVSVRLKTAYALKKNLGGIMFWELGNDTKDEDSLLKSIYQASSQER
jgi:chitinase